ncbi:MAG: hypothetical protein BMS9Abin06_0295 [Gammaproteobacteria bacterium]|nr:MAG: hypothetical protein BMS9Abin06_0295 [Gammaproteobacteria bacterium]
MTDNKRQIADLPTYPFRYNDEQCADVSEWVQIEVDKLDTFCQLAELLINEFITHDTANKDVFSSPAVSRKSR